jgi:TrmH family RNA methyltransferase
MTRIVSPQNRRLQTVRRLHGRRERERSGCFLAEGEDLIDAAALAGRPPVEGFRVAGSDLGDQRFHEVAPDALAAVSTLGSGTRVMAVYEQRWSVAAGPLCVYLHGVSDPGNVGTVIRSAQAFGASCVAFGPGCADPHSPKAVRASMGAIFAVSLARVARIDELPGRLIALAPAGDRPLCGPGEGEGGGAAEPTTLLIGAEREGLPGEILAACDEVARIAIASESLNAAMAATVALYEMTRRPSRVRA